jgi:hypothetical protein
MYAERWGMNENNSIWRFGLATLAAWRATHLLAHEDGPWDGIARLRARLGTGVLGQLTDCFFCLSLWVALPLAVLTSNGWLGIAVHWLALSGAVCLLEKSTNSPEPEFQRVEVFEGVTSCVAVKREAI